jgi:hypothetical protein
MGVAVTGWPRGRLLAVAQGGTRFRVKRAAAWGYRAQHDGMGECGVLGARFEPHKYPYLRVSVAATSGAQSRRAPDRFLRARVGLTFDHAAVHEIDSSWEMLRLLAIGVVRLLGLPSDGRIPMDLLPRFGGSG